MDEQILDSLNQKLDSIVQRSRGVLEEGELQDRVDDLRKQAEELVRKYPYRTLAAGIVAGFLLGRLLSDDD